MQDVDTETAIRLLAIASESGECLEALPQASRPASTAEAQAMQAKLLARLGKSVSGWKVANDPSGKSMWGAIFAADVFPTPAEVDGRAYAPMGIEGEIAFRFDHDLPPRTEPYSRAEIEAAVTAFPAIEIVASRFTSYQDTPSLDRLIDRMSNGGLVVGQARPDWQNFDLANLRVSLSRDGEQILDRTGGHSRGDPLLPLIDFIHAVQTEKTFQAGEMVTTGTLTGLVNGKPGETFIVDFHGFGSVQITFA